MPSLFHDIKSLLTYERELFLWKYRLVVSVDKYLFLCNPDLTQEVASKGLGLVYEHGGEENKRELVSLLVDTLASGRR